MKIISWNCQGNFRSKYSIIKQYDADIYVIQECENPKKHPNILTDFYANYFWYGEKDSKGLAIFAKPEIRMLKNEWQTYCLRHFVSVKVNDTFDLLGVWASAPYIEEYYIYQTINFDKYSKSTIVMGDFNSNAIWDKDHGKRNHSVVVRELSEIGLLSAYHVVTGEKAGQETQSTFFLHRNKSKGYHIDYCFLDKDRLKHYQIFNKEDWIKHSDHLPIEVIIE